ncbi:hypothetical protein MVEN_00724100 [Mycena venus]|uniref:Uncharacterized protein n=1 Tax=Mycena venus TaxID=2733690 RepID=A0A8H6YJ00_9AGAR|nr:hypothetical protein MVEN_00724100 [Mycena venus]
MDLTSATALERYLVPFTFILTPSVLSVFILELFTIKITWFSPQSSTKSLALTLALAFALALAPPCSSPTLTSPVPRSLFPFSTPWSLGYQPRYQLVLLALRRSRSNSAATARRNLRLEFIAAFQNPSNLLDSNPYSPPSSDTNTLFDSVPAGLAHHNNLSPHSPSSPTLAWLYNDPPTPISSPPHQNSAPMPAAPAPTPMPARGDRNAPQFDSTKPHELRRYFTDLEFSLGRAAVTDDAEMKKHATRFLSVENQEIWEGNDEDRRFGLNDLDALVGQYSQVGILSLDDLKTFYRQFLRITTYLIEKKRLSKGEQSRSFLRAMQLRIRLTHFLLPTFTRRSLALDVHTAPSISSTSSAPVSTPTTIEVKPDPGIAALVGTMAKLIEVLAMQKPSETSNENSQKKMRPDGCGYFSDLSHFINQCPHVLADIQAGKCRRNTDGRVLPTGAFIPRTITGKDLRSRIEKWHEQNPGQMAAAQSLVEVAVNHSPLPSSSPSTGIYTLTEEQRLQVLQHEINALQTRAQARKALEKRSNGSADRTIPPPPHHSTPPAAAAPAAPVVPTEPTAQSVSQGPLHPFANARDAAYAPPKQRNLGAPATTPIYNEKDAADVFNAVLDAPCQLTTRQVLSISPTFALTSDEQRDKDALYSAFIDSLPATYISSEKANLPDGGVVVPDPYASSAIRSILPIIDNQQQVECIVDGGSQIIAMAEAVCHDLALSYDPHIILRMQSANGAITPSLGLARNVPFRVGDITLYLQDDLSTF